MSFLRAHSLAFSYPHSEPLLEGAEFHLEPGWTGLVGANGAGKTTLLRLLCGELEPTEGHVQVHPDGARVRVCAQSVEQADEGVLALSSATSGAARRAVGELHLDVTRVADWERLSPGERKRWQIAAALAEEPDALLLDEPTNHLDAVARGWLLEGLRSYRGVGIVVSHDRAFLDALTARTLRVASGTARLWPGGYTQARVEWEREAEALQEERDRRKQEHARTTRRLDEKRRALQATTAQKSAGRRMRGPKDRDATSLMADFRVGQAEKRIGREVGVLRRAAERAESALAQVEIEKTLGSAVAVGFEPSPNPWISTLEAPVLEALVVPIRGVTQLAVGRLDRIHLAGANGAGKTTLLKALLAAARVARDRILYLPQDLTAEDELAALEWVRDLAPAARGRVLSIVAALGVDPDRLLASERPSPGEARKLLLARGLGERAWVLVLDEPTNHLDLPSIERLQAALVAYPGALLLVTHDDALARATARTRWTLSGGTLLVESVA